MLPRVSVIISIFNGERFLAEALDSILAQRYPDLEILAVDDGSRDKSPEIVATYPEVKLFRQGNRGVAAARNFGVSQSAGEFLAFLDQDDRWQPNKLQMQLDYFTRHPAADYVLGHQRLFLESGCSLPTWVSPEQLQHAHPALHLGTLLLRRPFFDRVGDFDTGYRWSSDADWLVRAKRHAPMHFLPEVLLHKRLHGANESHQYLKMQQETLLIFKRGMLRTLSERKDLGR